MSTDIPKHENELAEEYIYRVCSQKETIGKWDDVASLLSKELNHEYSESKYRKQFQAFNKMFEANLQKFIGSDEYIQEIENKRRELEKERVKLNTTKLEYSRQLRHQSRFELFYENIRQAIERLPGSA